MVGIKGLPKYTLSKTVLRNSAELKMDFLVYGMELCVLQPNVWLIKLAFSSRGIVSVLFI